MNDKAESKYAIHAAAREGRSESAVMLVNAKTLLNYFIDDI
jgi:hypothetical protein